ncbi:integrase [Rhizobium sp. SG_E_25_P2]|uniref:tyrosine-type recombinase/integrase n=1 Tax=Rhizobium sp. SG_E_25_P2 TaxID=2879942 RepID=UPI002473504C|nr:site-specific integrase [Rhizobium sp. SG_E_25_P2]MDH6269684.1 integrase [Rhizobium sp. SG_E_25_P2]
MLHDPNPTRKTPFTLFQREGTQNWSMRYSLGGKQYKKTLGTADEQEALQRAYEIWHEQSFRAKQGLSLDSHAFSSVAEEFIEKIIAEAERDERSKYHPIYWPPIIRRFPVGYFGERGIETITTADIERYIEWRKTYWTTGPGIEIQKIRVEREDGRVFVRPAPRKVAALSTMKGEMVIIREIFDRAAKWGYCKPIVVPAVKTRKKPDTRRPGFSPEEYEKLLQKSLERISEPQQSVKLVKAKDGRIWSQSTLTDRVRSDRIRLHAYVELMANTGLRPTEAKNLIWRDILRYRETRKLPQYQQDARLQVHGKGKHGNAVPLHGAIQALHMLWIVFEGEVGREPQDEDPVFADAKGKAILSFSRGLNSLLKSAGLERDNRGAKRTAYSLRHYYISMMLAQNVSVHHIARNTRTSIAMIDKHYAQVNTEQIRDYLRPGEEELRKEPVLLDSATFDEIRQLEKWLAELRAGKSMSQ